MPDRESFWRRVRTRGGNGLNPALAWIFAVWLTHAALRVVVLFRKDAYGFPFVGKPDWYLFHAWCVDWLWITGWSLPWLALALAGGVMGKPWMHRLALLALVVFHTALLPFTVLDHETMRFLGMHLDLSLMATYGNAASSRDLGKFVAADLSVPYLPYALLAGCVPAAFGWFFHVRRYRWARAEALGRVPAIMAIFAILSVIFLDYIWPGRFRMRKLKPFISTLQEGLEQHRGRPPEPVPLAALGEVVRERWLLEQGDDAYVFPDTSYPFYKLPLLEACARRAADPERCALDADGDGSPASADCDDRDPRSHPGAQDIGGDGTDQDCDGIDAAPPNYIILFMESHRAVNAGHLRPFGALPGLPDSVNPTPVLDSLVRSGAHAWTRFSCTGVPTINAIITMHLSIVQHPGRYIATDFTTMRNRSFTSEMAAHGYFTRYFSAADPAWDGKVPWLRQWYQGIRYDRSRETDMDMFKDMAAWLRDSLPADKPFLVAALTKTNHYPFNPEPGVPATPSGASLAERMRATMSYTDESFGALLDGIRGQPWFRNTLIIVLADHGFPLSEHGSSTIGHGLYNESVWIPFVIAGDHPKLGPGALHDYPASQLDLGPTVLDLAGIRAPNHFLGHSLVRPATGLNSSSYLVRGEQGSLEQGHFRIHGPLGERPREQGIEVFNTTVDRLEKRNLYPDDPEAKAAYDSLVPRLQALEKLNTYLVEADRLWPDSAAGNRESRAAAK